MSVCNSGATCNSIEGPPCWRVALVRWQKAAGSSKSSFRTLTLTPNFSFPPNLWRKSERSLMSWKEGWGGGEGVSQKPYFRSHGSFPTTSPLSNCPTIAFSSPGDHTQVKTLDNNVLPENNINCRRKKICQEKKLPGKKYTPPPSL